MQLDIEEVWCIALTSNLKLIDFKMIFRGTVDQCTIHPRDIFRFACCANASRIILAHNHPSGDLEPSTQDLLITKQILNCSKIIQIPLLDHLILTSNMYFSFADQGLVFDSNIGSTLGGPLPTASST
jgi:DNA repair protein RadC